MVKSVLLVASLMLIASDAQLSTVSKRFRNTKEVEFGRSNVVRKSSRGEGQRKRLLMAKHEKEHKDTGADLVEDMTPLSAAGSMSMGDFDIDSMSMEMSVSFEEEPMSVDVEEPQEEEAVEEEVSVEFTPVPEPEPVGCNGDEYCSADEKCQCWLFCRFCFFPPCGTCVPN